MPISSVTTGASANGSCGVCFCAPPEDGATCVCLSDTTGTLWRTILRTRCVACAGVDVEGCAAAAA
jgi:hypothetical protein